MGLRDAARGDGVAEVVELQLEDSGGGCSAKWG